MQHLQAHSLSFYQARQMLPQVLRRQLELAQLVRQVKTAPDYNQQRLTTLVSNLVQDHHAMIQKNLGRPQRVSGFLMGQVMKLTRGQADPQLTQNIIAEVLKQQSAERSV